MLTNSVQNVPRGYRDCSSDYPGAVGLRFRVGNNEYFRVGFENENKFRALCWHVVLDKMVKGEVEMTEKEHDDWTAQGLRLAPGKEPDHFYSIEPIRFESEYMMALGYHGLK